MRLGIKESFTAKTSGKKTSDMILKGEELFTELTEKEFFDGLLQGLEKRGLFQSSVGKLVNADVNGALNIMRKVVGDSEIVSRIINSGRLFRPLKFNNLYSLRNIEVYK